MVKQSCSGLTACPTSTGLHSRQHDDEIQLYAFDILSLGGDDLRALMRLIDLLAVIGATVGW